MYSQSDFQHYPKALNYAYLILILLFFSSYEACVEEHRLMAEKSVTGFVKQVEPESLDTFSSLIIVDHDGIFWEFGKGKFPDFNPSHLLQHKVTKDPITISYVKETNGILRVLKITDADH